MPPPWVRPAGRPCAGIKAQLSAGDVRPARGRGAIATVRRTAKKRRQAAVRRTHSIKKTAFQESTREPTGDPRERKRDAPFCQARPRFALTCRRRPAYLSGKSLPGAIRGNGSTVAAQGEQGAEGRGVVHEGGSAPDGIPTPARARHPAWRERSAKPGASAVVRISHQL